MEAKTWVFYLLLSCLCVGFAIDLKSAMLGVPSGVALTICFFGMMDKYLDDN